MIGSRLGHQLARVIRLLFRLSVSQLRVFSFSIRDSSTSLGMTRKVSALYEKDAPPIYQTLRGHWQRACLRNEIGHAVRGEIRETASHSHSWRHWLHRTIPGPLCACSRTQGHNVQPRQNASA